MMKADEAVTVMFWNLLRVLVRTVAQGHGGRNPDSLWARRRLPISFHHVSRYSQAETEFLYRLPMHTIKAASSPHVQLVFTEPWSFSFWSTLYWPRLYQPRAAWGPVFLMDLMSLLVPTLRFLQRNLLVQVKNSLVMGFTLRGFSLPTLQPNSFSLSMPFSAPG